MSDYFLKPEVILPRIEKWLQNKLSEASSGGCVLGLSGGIDSAVVAAILRRVCGNNMLAVVMPCHSMEQDMKDASLLIEKLDLPFATVDLSNSYDALVKEAEKNATVLTKEALANVKPRLRMATLYLLAQTSGYLVCGTSNLVETKLGYFTKYGDSGTDLLPIGGLYKTEVRELAKYLNIPEGIINKAPSAGLWKGQTDEKEMGLTYYEIDSYFSGQEVSEDVKARILEKVRSSEHKRNMPPVCTLR